MLKFKKVLLSTAFLVLVPATAYALGTNQVVADLVKGLQVQIDEVKVKPSAVLRHEDIDYVPVKETFEASGYTVAKGANGYVISLNDSGLPTINSNKKVIVEELALHPDVWQRYDKKYMGSFEGEIIINIPTALKTNPILKIEIINDKKKVVAAATRSAYIDAKTAGQKAFSLYSSDFQLPFKVTSEAIGVAKLASAYKYRITIK